MHVLRSRERIPFGEIRGVNHQRIALPMADRVTVPLADAFGYMRTAVRGDDANVMDLFCFNGYVSRPLHDLQIAVVSRGKQGHYIRTSKTPGAQGEILRAVEFVSFGLGSYFREPRASLRRQRRNPPIRPHNDRGPLVPGQFRLTAVQPELREIV